MSDFISKFIEDLNKQKILNVYYDDASKDAKYPYGVINNLYEQNLRYGSQIYFDLFIWSDGTIKSEDLEEKVQEIKKHCDSKIFNDIPAIVYVETIKNVDDSDYTKVKKQISFVARIM